MWHKMKRFLGLHSQLKSVWDMWCSCFYWNSRCSLGFSQTNHKETSDFNTVEFVEPNHCNCIWTGRNGQIMALNRALDKLPPVTVILINALEHLHETPLISLKNFYLHLSCFAISENRWKPTPFTLDLSRSLQKIIYEFRIKPEQQFHSKLTWATHTVETWY